MVYICGRDLVHDRDCDCAQGNFLWTASGPHTQSAWNLMKCTLLQVMSMKVWNYAHTVYEYMNLPQIMPHYQIICKQTCECVYLLLVLCRKRSDTDFLARILHRCTHTYTRKISWAKPCVVGWCRVCGWRCDVCMCIYYSCHLNLLVCGLWWYTHIPVCWEIACVWFARTHAYIFSHDSNMCMISIVASSPIIWALERVW